MNKIIHVLRLPVGHSELNAIELIWAQVKNEVARRNVTDVKALMHEALQNVRPRNWKQAIKHTQKVESAFRKIDFVEDDQVNVETEQLIIEVSFNESSSESESDSDSEFDE